VAGELDLDPDASINNGVAPDLIIQSGGVWGNSLSSDDDEGDYGDVSATFYSSARVRGTMEFDGVLGNFEFLAYSYADFTDSDLLVEEVQGQRTVVVFHDYISIQDVRLGDPDGDGIYINTKEVGFSAGRNFNVDRFSLEVEEGTSAARVRAQFGPFASLGEFILRAEAYDIMTGTGFAAATIDDNTPDVDDDDGFVVASFSQASSKPSTIWFEPNAMISELIIEGNVVLFGNGLVTDDVRQSDDDDNTFEIVEHYFTCNAQIGDLIVSTPNQALVSAVAYVEPGSFIGNENYGGLGLATRKRDAQLIRECGGYDNCVRIRCTNFDGEGCEFSESCQTFGNKKRYDEDVCDEGFECNEDTFICVESEESNDENQQIPEDEDPDK